MVLFDRFVVLGNSIPRVGGQFTQYLCCYSTKDSSRSSSLCAWIIAFAIGGLGVWIGLIDTIIYRSYCCADTLEELGFFLFGFVCVIGH